MGSGESSTPVPAASEGTGGRAEPDVVAARDDLGACVQRIERARHKPPVAAIVGASYTAGVGPGDATRSWAVLLARRLGWNAVIYGVPGAGYVRMGSGDEGPAMRMLDHIGLRGLDPSLVIVQLGHDDIGVPARTERRWVARTIGLIHAADPRARIALVTVFNGRGGKFAARRTDSEIVAAARGADHDAIIMDPQTGHWVYPRAHDGLHPTAAGDAWIAAKAEAILRKHGIREATAGTAIVCDSGISDHRTL